jgi:acyl-[acyl-carrier-protein]-phospholipid O-acyltransferase/long-chain-fatty-acid--[acyl-carrier-protein] ligase
MSDNQFLLLKDTRFYPLFITQFLGAFHDNLFKNALVVLLLYSAVISTSIDPKILVTLATGVFIFPFILFSALGGQLADKFPKHKVIRAIKLAEIGIAITGSISLMSGSLLMCFLTLFCLGAQSAFFGPSKYSILPQHLKVEELIGGNALLNTGTFLAILIGTIAGTVLAPLALGIEFICLGLILCAFFGYVSSRKIPEAKAKDPDTKLEFNPLVETRDVLKYTYAQNKIIVRSILGVAWFYFLGAMFMAQFPNFTQGTLHANEHVLALFLVVFSVGIAVGGLLNNRLLKGRVEATFAPLAIVGITIFSIDLFFAGGRYSADSMQQLFSSQDPASLAGFLSEPSAYRVIFDIAMISLCGGLFVVPLNAIIQNSTEEHHRARVMAGSAITNAGFIVASSLISALLIKIGFEVRELFLFFSLLNLFVAVYICALLPDYLLKTLLQGLFKLLYKVEVKGLENLEKAGNKAVIVGNHVSLLDPPLLAAFLPGRPMFAVNTHVANWWWLRPFLKLVDAFPLDPTNPFTMKALIRKVEENRHVVIFPEGRLTETGALMKVYDGPGMIADKTDAMILPVRLDGVQHTAFARLKGKVPLKSFPKITITILEPRKFKIDENIKGRARRAEAGRKLYDLMEDMMFLTGDTEQTLYQAMLRARYVNGDKAIIAEDVARQPLRFKELINRSVVIGRTLSEATELSENVGVLLPNSIASLTTFFGLQCYGRVAAMLNFSSGEQALLAACEASQIKNIVTSRRFVELGKLEEILSALARQANIIYLEDIKERVSISDKLYAMFASPARLHAKFKLDPNNPALILFTSGSEGLPKGVVLSHKNIMSNIVQLSSRVDFNRQDIVFNCLPMFHSFGLTGGTLLPVLSGVKVFLYPSPLHYRIVPELVYSSNATIMFGTDTFLSGYARMAGPYDFYRMRYIFAGAEKVKAETKELYMNRFGVRILEGYGATETSPALSLNSPMKFKEGSVGQLLPGIEYRIEDVPGVEKGGRLFVRGPNVMRGYYKYDRPGIIQPPEGGWYDTGDIVEVDAHGFVTILGRAKRFAKIAGEMVSLTSVEDMVSKIYPEFENAVIAIPDSKKGEQLVLITTCESAVRQDLSQFASQNGIAELAVPKSIVIVEKMPVLGSGKTDYQDLQRLVDEKLKNAA